MRLGRTEPERGRGIGHLDESVQGVGSKYCQEAKESRTYRGHRDKHDEWGQGQQRDCTW